MWNNARKFGITAIACMVIAVTGCNGQLLPHPSCELKQNAIFLQCVSYELQLPGNFDISRIPTTVNWIALGGPNTIYPASPNRTFNTISANPQPLPSGSGPLQRVELIGFRGNSSGWSPFDILLTNVKGSLKQLTLFDCLITELPATFLRGYHALESVNVGYSGLKVINIEAFDTAGVNVLQTISLNQNELAALDWAVFAPAANNLKSIYIDRQKAPLTTLTNSKKFTLHRLTTLDLGSNQMTFPPQSLFDTINLTNKDSFQRLNFDRNSFCVDDVSGQCDCCAARDFVQWAHVVNASGTPRPYGGPIVLQFHCARNGDGQAEHWYVGGHDGGRLPALDQYGHCPTAAPSDDLSSSTRDPNGAVPKQSSVCVQMIFYCFAFHSYRGAVIVFTYSFVKWGLPLFKIVKMLFFFVY
ncbi:uncharacterized protein LOC129585177 [Paramacrobiotus metropolitanus]|uniref:uncharacterized protein LOC129585177 n=1 Tax=Paramacrobiotus metropolitanus TaxID=2943436 RepID=UPI002445809A|nr:uncharacterized protein LOC129585177 [Paramacrobiotus metropolitanus]